MWISTFGAAGVLRVTIIITGPACPIFTDVAGNRAVRTVFVGAREVETLVGGGGGDGGVLANQARRGAEVAGAEEE